MKNKTKGILKQKIKDKSKRLVFKKRLTFSDKKPSDTHIYINVLKKRLRAPNKKKEVDITDNEKRPNPIKLTYREPSDPLNLRKRFIDDEIKYIQNNPTEYSLKEFNDSLNVFLNKHPAVYWRYDDDFKNDMYNEILDRASKFIEQKKNINFEKEEKIGKRENSINKGRYTKFEDRFAELENATKLYLGKDNKTVEQMMKINKRIRLFADKKENVFTEEELKPIGLWNDYKDKLEAIEKAQELISSKDYLPVDTSSFLKVSPKKRQTRKKIPFKPLKEDPIFKDLFTPKPADKTVDEDNEDYEDDDEEYKPTSTKNLATFSSPVRRSTRKSAKDLSAILKKDDTMMTSTPVKPKGEKKKTEKQLEALANEKSDKLTNMLTDVITDELLVQAVDSIPIVSGEDVIKQKFDTIDGRNLKGNHKGKKALYMNFAIDHDIVPHENEPYLKYLERIFLKMNEAPVMNLKEEPPVMSLKEELAQATTTAGPTVGPVEEDEVFDSDKISVAPVEHVDPYVLKQLNEIRKIEERINDITQDLDKSIDRSQKEESIIFLRKEISKVQKLINNYEALNAKSKKEASGFFKDAFNKVKHVLFNSGSPQTDKMVKKYGDYFVKRAMIHRKPVDKILKDVINVLTLGQFNNYRREYDDVFHLAVIFKLEDKAGHTVYLLTEKRPNIFWSEVSSLDSYESHNDKLEVKLESFPPIQFNKLIEETKKVMGDKFNKYQAKDNNCQVWILSLFDAIFKIVGQGGINSPVFKMIKNYIYQDMTSYLTKTSSDVANKVTDLGHVFNRILYGAALRKRVHNRRF
jgi:hypothetical protein